MKISQNKEEKTLQYAVFHTDYYTLRWAVGPAEKFKERLRKIIDKRGDWESMLYQEVMKRMNFVKSKDAHLNLDKVLYEETVQGFADAYIKHFKVDTTPQQQTIDEAIKGESPKRVKITPVKKSNSAAAAKEKAASPSEA